MLGLGRLGGKCPSEVRGANNERRELIMSGMSLRDPKSDRHSTRHCRCHQNEPGNGAAGRKGSKSSREQPGMGEVASTAPKSTGRCSPAACTDAVISAFQDNPQYHSVPFQASSRMLPCRISFVMGGTRDARLIFHTVLSSNL